MAFRVVIEGASQADYRPVSRVMKFPDGLARHITLPAHTWRAWDRLIGRGQLSASEALFQALDDLEDYDFLDPPEVLVRDSIRLSVHHRRNTIEEGVRGPANTNDIVLNPPKAQIGPDLWLHFEKARGWPHVRPPV